jgi:CRISPR-associated endonuclease/helicase Cas3
MSAAAEFDALFRLETGAEPYPWQRTLALGQELPEVVRVPTGAGKTEGAALGWLWQRRYADSEIRRATPRRLVYCLPMRVLVEQTVTRLREELSAAGAGDVAVHQLMGGAIARDWWLRPEDDAVIVGTLDQLVSRALMRGYGVSRYAWPIHFGLLQNDALWVYDEVQLMGEALTTSAQLDAFRGSLPSGCAPVDSIWMSATVDPAWLSTVDRAPPERILTVSAEDRARGLALRLEARKTLSRVERIDASLVAEAHHEGMLTLVVANTVRAAQELESKLQRRGGLHAEVVLVHSRFRPAERAAAVAALLAPIDPGGPGRIVVATQVVEAGIDIDARTLVTEVAPWASLVQRFGRCNRAGRLDDAAVLWAAPAKPAPYEQAELDGASRLLGELEGHSVGPDDL